METNKKKKVYTTPIIIMQHVEFEESIAAASFCPKNEQTEVYQQFETIDDDVREIYW